MIIFPTPEQNLFLKAWIEKRLQASLGDCWCLGVMRSERLEAVAAFNNFKTEIHGQKIIPVNIEISFAADSPRWATRQVVTWILGYPFIEKKVQRITAMVKKSNKRTRRLLVGLGFKEEGCHPHAGANLETVFSYGMTRKVFMERYLSNVRPAKPGIDVGNSSPVNSISGPELLMRNSRA